MYDYYLGGKDHFEVDKQAAEAVAEAYPASSCAPARTAPSCTAPPGSSPGSTASASGWTSAPASPTEPNLHQVAQSRVPEARVVYADNDPLVLKYAERLMRSTPAGADRVHRGGRQRPRGAHRVRGAGRRAGHDRPVALSLNALMHFVTDAQDPYGIVEGLLALLPAGSALALSHCTPDFDPETWEKVTAIYTDAGTPVQFRSQKDVARFFDGLDLLDPGITVGHRWRPDAGSGTEQDSEPPTDAQVSLWTGVGIKR